MSSRIMMLSLFAVAGLNLSFWGVSASAANNCGQIGNQLSKNAQAQCQRSTKKFERKAESTVKVEKQVEKAEDGSEKVVGYNVEITTEADCGSCGVKSNEALRDNLVFPATENISEIRAQIDERAAELESDAFDHLSEQIKTQAAIEKCLVDKSGEKLDKEGRRECRIDRLGELDEEEAEEYFEKHLKADLLEKLKSGNAEERQEALELLSSLQEEAISEGLEQEIKGMIIMSKGIEAVQAKKSQAELLLLQAQSIPQGTPNRDQMIAQAQQRAQQIMGGMEQEIATLKYQAYTQSIQTGKPVDTSYADSMKEAYDAMMTSSPVLTEMKVNSTMNNTTGGTTVGSAADVNNDSRLQRGGGVTPLVIIPQTTAHPNTSHLTLPDVNSEVRVGQDRMPAPVLQQQGVPLNHMQPVPNQQHLQGVNYQWNQPFAAQTGFGSAPIMTLPMN